MPDVTGNQFREAVRKHRPDVADVIDSPAFRAAAAASSSTTSGKRKGAKKDLAILNGMLEQALGEAANNIPGEPKARIYILRHLFEAALTCGESPLCYEARDVSKAAPIGWFLSQYLRDLEVRVERERGKSRHGLVRIVRRVVPSPRARKPFDLVLTVRSSRESPAQLERRHLSKVSKAIDSSPATPAVPFLLASFPDPSSLAAQLKEVQDYVLSPDAAGATVAIVRRDDAESLSGSDLDRLSDVVRVGTSTGHPYDGVRSPAVGGDILVSQDVYRSLQHRFSFEPVGELAWSTKSALRPVVYRLISSLRTSRPTTDEAEKFDRFLATALESEETITRVKLDDLTHPSPSATQRFCRRMIYELEDTLPEGALVLHWQCAADRKTDLLRPFDECLGDLLALNRRSTFQSETSRIEIDVKEIVTRFLAGCTEGDSRAEIATTLEDLLGGSGDEQSFTSVVQRLAPFVAGLGRHKRAVRIVVESFEFVDEVTHLLIECLKGFLPEKDDVRIFLVEGGAAGSKVNVPLPSLPPEQWRLLKIAAILGCDFRHEWLRSCFKKSPDDTDDEAFLSALDASLRSGLLQFCDSLICVASPSPEFLRQLKWVDQDTYSAIRELALADGDLEAETLTSFKAWVRHSTNPSRLRLRARIFQLLKRLEMKESSDLEFMTGLGLFLGQRARYAGAITEAELRLQAAAGYWQRWFDGSAERLRFGMLIASELLKCWQVRVEKDAACHPVDSSLIGQVISAVQVSGLPKDSLIDWFQFARLAWSESVWRENLDAVQEKSNLLTDLAEQAHDHVLRLEAKHAAAVTNFNRGDLLACENVAKEGVIQCESSRTQPHPGKELWGSHDGRVCCKLFLGLSRLIRHGVDEEDWLGKAVSYATDRLKNVEEAGKKATLESLRMAFAYRALAHLLRENFEEALRDCVEAKRFRSSSQWILFTDLIEAASEIGKALPGAGQSSERLARIAELRTRWNKDEYSTLWLTFEGVATARTDADPVRARRCFERAKELVRNRGERVFAPLIDVWWARTDPAHRLKLVEHDLLVPEFPSQLYTDLLSRFRVT